nr:mRNA decay activator protein ZFP36L2-like isoform X2 [Lepeophtheirus salmonis]
MIKSSISRLPSVSSTTSSQHWTGTDLLQPSSAEGGRNSSRYKTEMCRNFKERSRCIYGEQCQFAHGRTDLRDVVRNTKYKTKLCQKYWISGYCAYGPRCNFLHDEGIAKQLALSEALLPIGNPKKSTGGSLSPVSSPASTPTEEATSCENRQPISSLWPITSCD